MVKQRQQLLRSLMPIHLQLLWNIYCKYFHSSSHYSTNLSHFFIYILLLFKSRQNTEDLLGLRCSTNSSICHRRTKLFHSFSYAESYSLLCPTNSSSSFSFSSTASDRCLSRCPLFRADSPQVIYFTFTL